VHVTLPLGAQFVLLSDHLVIIPTLKWALASSGFIAGTVTVISVIPSFIAARLKPASAMSHAG
jgi:hypothetical protein